jgi:integrase/recombinase XerC
MEKVANSKAKVIPFHKPSQLQGKGYESLVEDWLGKFSSVHTIRVYRSTIVEFFQFLSEEGLTSQSEFLLLEQTQALELVGNYEGWLIKKELAPATINRKLASIKSLVNYASEVGKCFYTLSKIKSKAVTTYRDTTGISSETFKLMLAQVDTKTLKGKRDYAILLLLWGNALRRSEVIQCKVRDFDPEEKRLWILGKGKKGQKQGVSLGKETIRAIESWLEARGEVNEDEPLFCSVHKGYWDNQLHSDSIYKLVKRYGQLAGIKKTISPHRLRHSAITAALEITNGDVRAVQKLSRHSSLNTLMVYDDNRRNEQGRVTDLLEDLL